MKKYLEHTVTYFAPIFFHLSFDFSVFNCNCFFYSSENYFQQTASVQEDCKETDLYYPMQSRNPLGLIEVLSRYLFCSRNSVFETNYKIIHVLDFPSSPPPPPPPAAFSAKKKKKKK